MLLTAFLGVSLGACGSVAAPAAAKARLRAQAEAGYLRLNATYWRALSSVRLDDAAGLADATEAFAQGLGGVRYPDDSQADTQALIYAATALAADYRKIGYLKATDPAGLEVSGRVAAKSVTDRDALIDADSKLVDLRRAPG